MVSVIEIPPSSGKSGGEPEQALYFTSGGLRLFATLHRPADPRGAKGGWLLCAPFGEERGFAQRLMVEWARALAGAGHWVLRFDYRGYGDSQGLFGQFTAEDHVADILAAHAELERRSGVPCEGLWGLRLGASLAACAARRAGLDVALALWEPVVDGDRYMDDLLRGVMAKEMANTGRAPRTRDELKAHLAAGGEVVVEGHPLTDATYKSIASIDLTEPGNPFAKRAFLAQISRRVEGKPRRDMTALLRALGEAELRLVQVPSPWLQNDDYAVCPEPLFAPTLRWIETLPPAPTAAPAAGDVGNAGGQEFALDGGERERAVTIPAPDGALRAILHLPRAVDPARSAVVLVTPGFNCRTARYRLYVKFARELARRGWVVLRPDPHGIGDSDGALPYPTVAELYNAIEGGLFTEDTRAAISFLERELAVGTVLLVGLCGGATTSVRVGAADRRVTGILASELPFLFTPRQGSDEDAQRPPVARAAADHFLRSYVRKLADPEAWRRFFSMKSDYRSLARSLRVAVSKRVLRTRVHANDGWFSQRLGPRANLGLVEAFRRCLERGIPVFCLFGATNNSWYFSEIWPGFPKAVPGAEARVQVKSVPDADPGFSLPSHTREFLDTAVSWVEEHGMATARSPAATGT